MRKITSLKLNKEFKRAYYQGKFKAHPLLITYMIKNRSRVSRIGITTSKKVGCAVKRNRCRRIIKSAYSELLGEGFFDNYIFDFVFVARTDTVLSCTKKIKEVMKNQVSKLALTNATKPKQKG